MDNKVKDTLFIPKTIKVGYQNRSDTYTGKLAYIIYTDHTGKLRKEKSWNNWRDKDIKENDFDNSPIEGFVLNKHIGGHKSYWNFRQSYCRIYDPRGFEFEITINNLLWILEIEDCLHGKGLTGKYVYGWDKDQLILIPYKSEDYTLSKKITDNMYKGTNKNNLIPGALYKIKVPNNYINCISDELVFIGELKLQNKLNSYKSTLMFYDLNEHEKYDWDKKENVNIKYDWLIRIDKKNILSLITEDAISNEEINELTHRFELSAYSYEFWKHNNIIDKFIDNVDEYPYFKFSDWKEKLQYCYRNDIYYHKCCKLIDNKHIILYKEYKYQKEISYKEYNIITEKYKFIKLDNNLNIDKICDFGKYSNDIDTFSSIYQKYEFKSIYSDGNEDDLKNKEVIDSNELTQVYYITKDGYISDSLTNLIYTDSLSYISDINLSNNRCIVLPTKIKD